MPKAGRRNFHETSVRENLADLLAKTEADDGRPGRQPPGSSDTPWQLYRGQRGLDPAPEFLWIFQADGEPDQVP